MNRTKGENMYTNIEKIREFEKQRLKDFYKKIKSQEENFQTQTHYSENFRAIVHRNTLGIIHQFVECFPEVLEEDAPKKDSEIEWNQDPFPGFSYTTFGKLAFDKEQYKPETCAECEFAYTKKVDGNDACLCPFLFGALEQSAKKRENCPFEEAKNEAHAAYQARLIDVYLQLKEIYGDTGRWFENEE
jgi:hypothetical protein